MSDNPLTLEDALWNAVLFTDRKSYIGDQIRVAEIGGYGTEVTGSDDHVIIATDAAVPLGGDNLYPTIKETKEWIRDIENGVNGSFGEEHTPSEMWQNVDGMLKLKPTSLERASSKFALRPERFSKFSRIRSGEDYPVDFYFGYSSQYERDLLLFKVGPWVRGVVAPVLRSALDMEFDGKASW